MIPNTFTKFFIFIIILTGTLYPALHDLHGDFQASTLSDRSSEAEITKEKKRLISAIEVLYDKQYLYLDVSDYLGKNLSMAKFKFIDLGTTNPEVLKLSALEDTPTAVTLQEGYKRTAKLTSGRYYRIEVYDNTEKLKSYATVYVENGLAKTGAAPTKFDGGSVKGLKTVMITKPKQKLEWKEMNSTLFYTVTLTSTDSEVEKTLRTDRPFLSPKWGKDIPDGEYTYSVCRTDQYGYEQTSCPSAKLQVITSVATDSVTVEPKAGIYDPGTVISITNDDEDVEVYYWTTINEREGKHEKMREEVSITLTANTKLFYYVKNKKTNTTSPTVKLVYLVKGDESSKSKVQSPSKPKPKKARRPSTSLKERLQQRLNSLIR